MAMGKMATTSYGIARGETGVPQAGDGTALVVTLGYTPSKIEVFDMTAGVKYEFVNGMAANTTLKGGNTVDTTGAIVQVPGGFVVSAAVNQNGNNIVWYAE